MDILYKRGRATASEVLDDLPGTPALLDRSHATAGPGRKRARHARRGRRPLRLHARDCRGGLRGSRRCATSSTRFSTGRPSRSSRPCSAARAPGCLTKSSTASQSSSTKRRKKEADEDVLDCLRRAGGVVPPPAPFRGAAALGAGGRSCVRGVGAVSDRRRARRGRCRLRRRQRSVV